MVRRFLTHLSDFKATKLNKRILLSAIFFRWLHKKGNTHALNSYKVKLDSETFTDKDKPPAQIVLESIATEHKMT